MDERMKQLAVDIATKAHRCQTRSNGEPYINHPLRVAARFSDITSYVVAVLHDVVEDTDVTLNDLRKAGFSEEVVHAIDLLTRRELDSLTMEPYWRYIERIASEESVAIVVKLSDLEDNMSDLDTLSSRYTKYKLAHMFLTQCVD